ncbi:MAG: SDR family NAD(P)-dependent oxidoreductase [Planctomycetota bacterium]|jgi:NAD(P)-dependent dehydrogenase (short-subunit alcohol dehydrogenase family)
MGSQQEAVIITGASRGIGLELALTLSGEYGFNIFAGVRREEDIANIHSQNRCETTGRGKLTPVLLDVTEPDHVRNTSELVSLKTGESGVKGILNVAGIYKGGPLEFADIEELQKVYNVQVYGTIRIKKEK